MKIDDITLDNLRIVNFKGCNENYYNLVVDTDIPYIQVYFDTWMAGRGPLKNTKESHPVEGLVIFKGIRNEDLKKGTMIRILIEYERPSINPDL